MKLLVLCTLIIAIALLAPVAGVTKKEFNNKFSLGEADESSSSSRDDSSESDTENCPSREECVECAQTYCDINGDGYIDVEEIRALKEKYLTFIERFFAFMLSQSPERMIELCGDNGRITRASFAKNKDSCLATCMKRRLFMQKICLPAQHEKDLEEEEDEETSSA